MRRRLTVLIGLALALATLTPAFGRVGGAGRLMIGFGAGGGSGETLTIVVRSGTYGVAVHTKGFSSRTILLPCVSVMGKGLASPTHPVTLYANGPLGGGRAVIKIIDRGGTGRNDEWGMAQIGSISGPLCGASWVPTHHFSVGNFVTV